MNSKKFCRISLIILFLAAFATSCRNNYDEPEYSYFVSKQIISSYSKGYIGNVIDIASVLYPEIADFRELAGSGVNIYKMVYETMIEGNRILASGIVCVPSEPGNYPVLSFQNGTNTQHANAPSENSESPAFQLVQVISSMGYVVVIADYPGFGESSEIPHPYLVAVPTVRSLVDMLHAVKEMDARDLPDISLLNEYYLLGYSQGGWATLQLHKALELEYNSDFRLEGSCCGAGPYNISLLMQRIFRQETFPMPYYLGYVLNAYSAYHQFTNPVSDILNEPYASRLESLFTGQLNSGSINSQLTTSIPELVNPDFLAGYATEPKYATVRQALQNNSIAPWKAQVPLLMIHGDSDTHVDPVTTENMYAAMIQAGTSTDVISKVILPGADHGEGVIPAMLKGFLFIDDLRKSN